MAVSRLFWCKEHRITGPLRAYADNDGHNFPAYGGIGAPADSAHADNDVQCVLKNEKVVTIVVRVTGASLQVSRFFWCKDHI